MRRLLGSLAALLTAVLLLTPSGARAAVPGVTPVVGQCRTMSWSVLEGQYDTSAVVSCSAPHTAYVAAVVPLDLDKLATLTEQAQTACETATHPYFTGSRVKRFESMWDLGFFIPTAAQEKAGAHWAECDIVIESTATHSLEPLPRTLHRPLVKGRQPQAARRCFAGNGAITSCAERHVWRVVGGFAVHQKSYPSSQQRARLGKRCSRYASGGRWLAAWPSAVGWASGFHVVDCARRTTH